MPGQSTRVANAPLNLPKRRVSRASTRRAWSSFKRPYCVQLLIVHHCLAKVGTGRAPHLLLGVQEVVLQEQASHLIVVRLVPAYVPSQPLAEPERGSGCPLAVWHPAPIEPEASDADHDRYINSCSHSQALLPELCLSPEPAPTGFGRCTSSSWEPLLGYYRGLFSIRHLLTLVPLRHRPQTDLKDRGSTSL